MSLEEKLKFKLLNVECFVCICMPSANVGFLCGHWRGGKDGGSPRNTRHCMKVMKLGRTHSQWHWCLWKGEVIKPSWMSWWRSLNLKDGIIILVLVSFTAFLGNLHLCSCPYFIWFQSVRGRLLGAQETKSSLWPMPHYNTWISFKNSVVLHKSLLLIFSWPRRRKREYPVM